jgi:hypothetical protein
MLESNISLNSLLRWSVEQDLSGILGDAIAHRMVQAGENLIYKHNEILHDSVTGDGKEMFQSMSVTLVPEPNIYLMMLAGMANIGFFTYKRRRTLLTENPVPA